MSTNTLTMTCKALESSLFSFTLSPLVQLVFPHLFYSSHTGSLPFLEHTRHTPASVPSQLPFHFKCPSPTRLTVMTIDLKSGTTFSVRPALTTLPKIVYFLRYSQSPFSVSFLFLALTVTYYTYSFMSLYSFFKVRSVPNVGLEHMTPRSRVACSTN